MDVKVEDVLHLDGLTVTKFEETVDKYNQPLQIIYCESTSRKPLCPYCDSQGYVHNYRDKDIRDKDNSAGRVVLRIKARSFKCIDCGKTYTEELSMVEPNAYITKRMRDFIGKAALHHTFDRIAGDYGLDPKTISLAFRKWVNIQDEKRKEATVCPRILGIDEAHLSPEGKKDGMRGVFVDVENSCVLDITEDRLKPTVIEWLENIPHNENLEVVTMDMWDGYRQAVYEVFRDKVLVVIDHFHVIQELIKQMQAAKNNVLDHVTAGTLKPHTDYQSLLRMNIEDLSKDQMQRLTRLLEDIPDLQIVYALKESFRAIYNIKDRKAAEEAFERWCKQIPDTDDFKPYKSVERTVRKWHKEIFNFFDTDRASNAVTEAMNGLIKKVNRNGNGYSFEVLRAKILYGAGTKAFTRTGKIPNPKYKESTNTFRDINMTYLFLMPSFIEPKYIDVKVNKPYGVSIDWLNKELDSNNFFAEYDTYEEDND